MQKVAVFIFTYLKACVGGAGKEEQKEFGFEDSSNGSVPPPLYFFFNFVKTENFNLIDRRLWSEALMLMGHAENKEI